MRAFQFPLHDPEAFSSLYQKNHLYVFRFIYGMMGGPLEEVEDLTCDTFMRAWKARSGFKGNEHEALCWLFTIARHLVIDAHRKRKGRMNFKDFSLDNELAENLLQSADPSPEEKAIIQEQVNRLWRALNRLPDEKREVLVLRYLLDWQVKEIAGYVRKEENTMSVFIRRCLEEIRLNWPPGSD